jgi:hypothetical protein
LSTTTFPFQLGDPLEHRGIVIAPLFPLRDPRARYITLDAALARGLMITETSEAGDVPKLTVTNPLPEDVLLYDGAELVGAKQNRILNVTVLVAAGSTLRIPVSCTEQGRWHSVSKSFAPAPHIVNAELRRRKAAALSASPLARGLAQHEVWKTVRSHAERLGSVSPTAAHRDLFLARERELDALAPMFRAQPGQCGAVLGLGDTLCLDAASRPDVFAEIWPKLRRGYLLDALEQLDLPATPPKRLLGFADEVVDAPLTRGPAAGLGTDVRLRGPAVLGSGLELEGEAIQLSAYSTREPADPTSKDARQSPRR